MVYGASAVPVVIEYIHVYNIPVFLANYPWSPVSQWVKPICQFHPPVFQPIWHKTYKDNTQWKNLAFIVQSVSWAFVRTLLTEFVGSEQFRGG